MGAPRSCKLQMSQMSHAVGEDWLLRPDGRLEEELETAAGLPLPQGSAAAARSRATDPAATRVEPTAIPGLRRCTDRATRRT